MNEAADAIVSDESLRAIDAIETDSMFRFMARELLDRRAADGYLQHLPGCASKANDVFHTHRSCTCGLDQLEFLKGKS